MSYSDYQEYRKILYDCGRFDMGEVVNGYSKEAKDQRLLMRKKSIEYERAHGEMHEHLVKNPRDYAQYCMIVNG